MYCRGQVTVSLPGPGTTLSGISAWSSRAMLYSLAHWGSISRNDTGGSAGDRDPENDGLGLGVALPEATTSQVSPGVGVADAPGVPVADIPSRPQPPSATGTASNGSRAFMNRMHQPSAPIRRGLAVERNSTRRPAGRR